MLKPIGRRVFCQPLEKEEASTPSTGEIIIPDSIKKNERAVRFVVVAVGPDCKVIEEGMIVFLPAYTTTVEVDGESYEMVQDGEILAIDETEG